MAFTVEVTVKNVVLNMPTFAFIVATRGMLGAGAGLLLADRLGLSRRRRIGATLLAIGVSTTLPALMALRRGRERSSDANSALDYDERLIGAARFPRKGDDYLS
jgi:hypothetical protein